MHLHCRQNAFRAEGFTLLEVVIAGMLLTIVALSLSSSMTVVLKSNAETQEREIARQAARAQIETVLAWPDFATLLTEFDGSTFAVGPLHGSGGQNDPAGAILIDDSDPLALGVAVRVEWVSPAGLQNLELRTFVADGG